MRRFRDDGRGMAQPLWPGCGRRLLHRGGPAPRGRLRRSSPCRVFLALVVACFSVAVPCQAQEEDRLHLGRLEVTGPLQALEVDSGTAGRTVWRGTVRPGETRTLLLPLAAPVVESVPTHGVLAPADDAAAPLPAWLTRRTPPAVRASSRRLGRTPLLLVLATWLVAVLVRRRPGAALAAGAAGSALLLLAPRALEAPGLERVVEVEGAGAEARWGLTEAAMGALRVPQRDAHVEIPDGGGVVWRVDGDAPEWTAEVAAGARIVRRASAPGRPPILEPALQALGTLEACWVREDGPWSPRGRWELGAAVPLPLGAGSPPPGWLAAGLPQGRWALVGALADTPATLGGAAASTCWLRALGRPLGPGER